MATKRRMSKKDKQKSLIFAVLIIALVFAGFFGGRSLGWWGATTSVKTSDDFIFYVEDLRTGEELDDDDHTIYLYRVDISDMDSEEIEDLTFSDYTLDTSSLDSGDDYDPDEDYKYYCKINGSDIVEYWFIPQTGELDGQANNHLYVTNTTEDVALAMLSVDEYEISFNSNTSGLAYDEWWVKTVTLDAAEGTGEKTTVEGYMPYYDFEDDDWNTIVLRIGFNTTAQLSFVDLESDYDHDESCSGDYTYFEIKAGIFGETDFKIDLGSGLGSTFEAMNCSIGYGIVGDSVTYWDTYTD